MRRILFVLLIWFAIPMGIAAAETADVACPASPLQPLNLPASRAALAQRQPFVILAFGSSSTEGARASDPAHNYPAQLQAMLAHALPATHLAVLNRGRGGQAIAEMLARLDQDVVAARPTLVIWQAGTNDAIRRGDPAAFRQAMAEGIARIRAGGADLVLMDSQRAPQVMTAPETPLFDRMMVELAETAGGGLFSRAALMRRWQAEGTPFAAMLTPDGLHHNDRGYHCVAQALTRSIAAALRPAPVVAGR